MKINVIGATGMIGSRVVAEAARRGHEVIAISRAGTAPQGAARTEAIDFADTAKIVPEIDAADATVIATGPDRTGGSHAPYLDAHRDLIAAKPKHRVLVVGGAGSLEVGGVQLKDMPQFPVAYHKEAVTVGEMLAAYRASQGLDWTVLSPAPMIAPGERSGSYRLGTDSPAGDAISAEDYAVAIVDELEKPAHRGRRFTVAN